MVYRAITGSKKEGMIEVHRRKGSEMGTDRGRQAKGETDR